jgi:tetratricopeptide (TPR) repeat protein
LDRGVQAYHEANFREAIEHLTEAVQSDPTLARALFVRGRTYQQLGQMNLALADYLAADSLESDGPTLACIGYCNNRLDLHGASIWNYEQAIGKGFANAALLNNLGFSYGQKRRNDEARACLDQAIALDPRLQAAYYNRAMLVCRHALRGHESLPDSAISDIQAAVSLGPVTPELLLEAARVYAVAAREQTRFVDLALEYLRRAFERGQDLRQCRSDRSFAALKDVPEFTRLVDHAPLPTISRTELCVVDPVNGLPE